MAFSRVYSKAGSEAGTYHIENRVADPSLWLTEAERNVLIRVLKTQSTFHRVEVLTYCVLGDSYHLLVRIPSRPARFDLALEEVITLTEKTLGPASLALLRSQLATWSGGGAAGRKQLEAWRRRQLRRMFSLTNFARDFKQQFTHVVNSARGRRGPFWKMRFQSTVVPHAGADLLAAAAKLDLRPVRAGLLEDPSSFLWCGFGAASLGDPDALAGLVNLTDPDPAADTPAARKEPPSARRRREERALKTYGKVIAAALSK